MPDLQDDMGSNPAQTKKVPSIKSYNKLLDVTVWYVLLIFHENPHNDFRNWT